METEKRLAELAQRSEKRKTYEYSDFLNAQMQEYAARNFSRYGITFWGGAEFTERKTVRFGKEDEIGYEENFPVVILKIMPAGGKFAKTVSHRDVLGALTALGIEREKIGDIFTGEISYAAVYDTVSELILRELTKVGSNNVTVSVANAIPQECMPKTQTVRFSAQSNRLDSVLSKTFNISRESANGLIGEQRVFINGITVNKASKELKTNDVVSARGLGKFRFLGEDGKSKKGKTYFITEVYK